MPFRQHLIETITEGYEEKLDVRIYDSLRDSVQDEVLSTLPGQDGAAHEYYRFKVVEAPFDSLETFYYNLRRALLLDSNPTKVIEVEYGEQVSTEGEREPLEGSLPLETVGILWDSGYSVKWPAKL